MTSPKKFYGKYRGTVINNADPMLMGRLQVMVPDVSTFLPTSWAVPCVPIAGIQAGMISVPLIGSGVWVEFEKGDPDYPIWVGGYWGSPAEYPAQAQLVPPNVPGITYQTPLQTSFSVSDVPGIGGINGRTKTGQSITVNEVGILIQNGQGASILMSGPSVIINAGALVIT